MQDMKSGIIGAEWMNNKCRLDVIKKFSLCWTDASPEGFQPLFRLPLSQTRTPIAAACDAC